MSESKLDTSLWCVNIHGPDDVIAAASHVEAVTMANRFNAWWQALKEKQPQREHDPRMWAVPIEWPGGDAASHARAVASPSDEYVWLRTPSLPASAEGGEAILHRLSWAAKILLQHVENSPEAVGAGGWLADCRRDIEAAALKAETSR